ncbi:hypothetical protein BGZ60DRAFT_402440 [Tricladium varicosporioides]|nr:hypothetical protein BGZ60DRAFT_402440 [Hymenoscyphus varicosporioides]
MLISQKSLQFQLNRQPKRNCAICSENLPIGDFPPSVTNRCGHPSAFCISCIQNWIAAQVNDGIFNEIYCPGEICSQRLRYRDIKRHATWDTYRRYDKFITRAKLDALPNFRWCLAPGCECGQEHDLAKKGPMFKCNKCKVRWCITHNTLWHTDKTCTEVDRDIGRAEDDKASKKLLEQISQRCPKCDIPIQRAGGCPHMTCRKCKHEFCWFCLAAWKVRNERGFMEHANTCSRVRNDLLTNIPMEYQEDFAGWGHL